MKKIFSFVIVAFAAIALNAAEAVFNFTDPASLNITPGQTGASETQLKGNSYTVGDVTIDFPSTATGNGFKLWTNTNGTYDLRVYQPNSFTVTSAGANISKIVFSFSDKGAIAPESGEIDATGAWLGDTASISFGVPEKGTVSKIKSITVYTGEAPIVVVDTLNVAEMNALINAAPDKKLSKQACVIGVVGGIDKSGAAQYGNINVWLADIRTANATDTIEAYRMKSYNGEKYKDEEDIQFGIGDTIVFFANDWKYYAENDVNEGVEGYLVEVVGTGHPEPVVYEEINVARALEIAQGLSPETGKTVSTTIKYNVQGFVVGISGKYENTFYLADDLEAYGEFQAFKSEIADGATVNEGDLVSVIGYISAYHGTGSEGDYYNYEVANGKLIVLEHTALPTVIAEKVSCKKMMINGQMYIKKEGKLYSVLGQAL